MTHEMMVGLTVTDDAVYTNYRTAMAPLLAEFGGGFRSKRLHEAPTAAAGPEARWLRREFSAASTDAAPNSLLALGLRCSASLAGHSRNHFSDFRVGEVLKSASEHPINRVFAIYFASRDAKDRFFADPRYLAVKKRFFEASVGGTTIFGSYDR